jgi:hypothetical protein
MALSDTRSSQKQCAHDDELNDDRAIGIVTDRDLVLRKQET